MQGVINSRLGQHLNSSMGAALISFGVGTVVILLANLLIQTRLDNLKQAFSAPWYLWTGGALGAVFVSSAILIVPRIGIASFLAAAVAGQLIISLYLDHIGFLGIPYREISLTRVAGILFLLTGVLLIQQK